MRVRKVLVDQLPAYDLRDYFALDLFVDLHRFFKVVQS